MATQSAKASFSGTENRTKNSVTRIDATKLRSLVNIRT
jgi:hypothetical protein